MEEVGKPQIETTQEEQKQPTIEEAGQPAHQAIPIESPETHESPNEGSHAQSQKSNPPAEESDDGQQFFVIKSTKQWNPRPAWLQQTEKCLDNFTTKFEQLKSEKQLLDKGLRQFEQNQRMWAHHIRSLPVFNKEEYFKKLKQDQEKHSLLEDLHPSILLLIFGFCHEDIYLQVLKMKRVCSSFRQLASEEIIYRYCMEYYLGDAVTASAISQSRNLQQELLQYCRSYSECKQAFLYYKSMQYSREIAQNSFRVDITQALRFVNEVHELVLKGETFQVEYFNLMNDFLLRHQAVIALTNLSIAGVQILRSAAVRALANHMAFNSKLSKMFVNKAQLQKSIKETEQTRVRLPLIVNTKLQEVMRQSDYHLTLFAYDEVQTYQQLFRERCDILWLNVEGVENSQIIQRAKFEKDTQHPNILLIDSSYLSISLDRNDKCLSCKVSHRQHEHFLKGEVYACFTANGLEKCWVFSSPQYILILRFLK